MKHFHYFIIAAVAFAAGSALAAGDVAITQKDQAFSQPSVTIAAGQHVVFTNADDVTHNISVRSSDDDTEDLGLQKPGQTVSFKFTDPGTYRVICSIHPKMKMTVVVK